ncbi:MAG: glycosyltransferase family 2 protein [Butyrivibrio sp.]|uniref:glycosyltransferase family 2 protein n=1 Tax=Butyrivibrio sp. TaxID=28121 RepID=UPI001B2BFF96|nr:glycosyltransferase family 2 protein [Butyrivibrio sp.]MBO6239416.1 glycosyltransferase family 2 protein [Butyrivibrio sp.]
MSDKISVALATYNGEKYIQEQLKSILRQTLKVDEIIICDDISSDNTEEVVKKFIRDNALENRIDFKVNEHNLGYASNFIKALRQTTGDYIFFCDQDDIWVDDRVENMVRILKENPDVLMIGSEFEPFKSSDDAPDVPGWELSKFKNDGSLEKLYFNSENIFIGCQGCTMAMKRSFLDEIDKYWYTGWAHDEYVWKLALSMEGLYFYHKVTLKRRLHSSNVTLHKEHEKEKRLKYLTDLLKSHEKTLEFIKSQNCDKEKIKLLKRHIKATNLRINLIKNRKLLNSLLLLGYMDCYHKKRSIPVELVMAMK